MRVASFWCVAVRLNAIMKIKNLCGITQRCVDFLFRPDVEGAFCGLAVAGIADPGYNGAISIFGREKAAFLRCHVASDIIKNVARNCFVLRVSSYLEGVKVSDRKLCLIVEHFLEVRHVPVTIDRVTMKTAADVIMHSPRGHFAQRKQSHLERLFAGVALWIPRVKSRQEIERNWSWKFWRITKPAFLWVITAVNLPVGGL